VPALLSHAFNEMVALDEHAARAARQVETTPFRTQ
jgi:hypothetical protein